MTETQSAENTETLEAPGQSGLKRTAAVVALLILVLYVPFLNKPFTIDDTVVLTVSQQILRDPLRPFDTTINWFGDPAPMFEVTTNPPFISYWLAPVMGIFGLNEIALHLSLLPYIVLMAVGVGILARRFCGGCLWPVLLVLSSPAVVVSVNCMRDVPAAALATAGIAFFVVGSDARDWRRLLLGGVFVGLAAFSKYPHIALVIVMAVYLLLYRRPKQLIWLVVPVVVLGLWFLQNHLGHDVSHLTYLKQERSDDTNYTWWMKLYGAVMILGSCLLLAPVILVREFGRWWRLALTLLLTALSVYLVGLFMMQQSGAFSSEEERSLAFWVLNPWQALDWQHGLWAATGGMMLIWILLETLTRGAAREGESSRKDTLFLLVWTLVPLVVSVFFIFFQAVRHQIPVIPPLVVLIVALLRSDGERFRRWLTPVLCAVVLIQSGLSLVVGYADYDFADFGRDFSAYVEERYGDKGEDVWFRGNWGYQMYARRAGESQIARHGEMPPDGAIVVWPTNVHKGGMPDGLRDRLEHLEDFERKQRLPVHTMTHGACFYATVGTNLPYRFDERETWKGVIYRVKPE